MASLLLPRIISQTLPRLAGPGVALDLMLTGRRLGADEAFRKGLLSKVVPTDTLESDCSIVKTSGAN